MTTLQITGFHGTTVQRADEILTSKLFRPSPGRHHWVGPGFYFWQDAPLRAWEWAIDASSRDASKSPPAVISAIIAIDKCFDLLDIGHEAALRGAYSQMVEEEKCAYGWTGEPPPVPTQQAPFFEDADGQRFYIGPKIDGAKNKYNYRDYDVIDRVMHDIFTRTGQRFTSARAAFSEGEMMYPSSFLFNRSHVQVAVIEPQSLSSFRLEDGETLAQLYRDKAVPRRTRFVG